MGEGAGSRGWTRTASRERGIGAAFGLWFAARVGTEARTGRRNRGILVMRILRAGGVAGPRWSREEGASIKYAAQGFSRKRRRVYNRSPLRSRPRLLSYPFPCRRSRRRSVGATIFAASETLETASAGYSERKDGQSNGARVLDARRSWVRQSCEFVWTSTLGPGERLMAKSRR